MTKSLLTATTITLGKSAPRDELKSCTSCDLVKYRNDDWSRSTNEKECKKRAAELDEALVNNLFIDDCEHSTEKLVWMCPCS